MWQRYELDPDCSRLHIVAQSTLHPIEATAKSVTGSFMARIADDGTIELPTGEEVAGSVQVESSEFKSGNGLLDRETRRRLDTRRHPTIDGVLTGTAQADGNYMLSGAVTCMGVTCDVEGEVHLEEQDGSIEMTGTQEFDIRDWGIKPPRILALKVHPDVEIRLEAVAVRAED